MSETYDPSGLESLSKRKRKLVAELAEVEARLAEEIPRAAAARFPQDKIVAWTEYSRSWVQKLEQKRRPPRWPSKDS